MLFKDAVRKSYTGDRALWMNWISVKRWDTYKQMLEEAALKSTVMNG